MEENNILRAKALLNFVVGGVFLLLGAVLLVFTVVMRTGVEQALWQAMLAVGLVLAGVGVVFGVMGVLKLKKAAKKDAEKDGVGVD